MDSLNTPNTPKLETPIASPIAENQKMINQIGYEGSYTTPESNLLLRSLLAGSGAGLAAGAVTNRNMWSPAWRTGVGSVLGRILASGATSNPMNQASNGDLGAILGGSAGLASAYLKKKKSEDKTVELPGLQLVAKTAGLQDVLTTVREQLPVMRAPDLLAGGLAGGGAGMLYDKIRSNDSETPATQTKNKWRRILGGAGIGAFGTNLIGDRTRRYISNTMLPFGYKNDAAALMAPTKKKVWDAAILDKPQQPGVADYLAGKYKGVWAEQPGLPYETTAANAAARRELVRLGMGFKNYNTNSIWKQQPDNTYSLNPQHKNVNNLLEEFMFPWSTDANRVFYKNPLETISGQNKEINPNTGMMAPISGGQRIPVYPYTGTSGQDYQAKFLKKWNVAVRDYEKEKAIQYLKDKYIHHKPEPQNWSLNDYQGDDSPERQISNLGKRWVLENAVMQDSPWVSQRMYFKRVPNNSLSNPSSYAAIPSTASGELYPGKSVGTWDPTVSTDAAAETPSGDVVYKTVQDILGSKKQ